jgi:hypothetical protein
MFTSLVKKCQFFCILTFVLICLPSILYVFFHRTVMQNNFNSNITAPLINNTNCSENVHDFDQHSFSICYWSEGLYIKICMRNLILPNCIIAEDYELHTLCKHLPSYLIPGRARLDESAAS